MPTLHVVIPVFNEPETLRPCLDRIVAVSLPENWHPRIILVDDHSRAASFADAEKLVEELTQRGCSVELHRHVRNRGKGAALRTGFDVLVKSPDVPDDDLVIIQDADLEYDPEDYPALMEPLLANRADAVLGTRWGPHFPVHSLKRRLHALGNGVLTKLSNLMTGYRVSDMECCYKLMRVSFLRRLRPALTEERFGIEPQIVAGLARLSARVEEVPVRYDPRGIDAGKKIGWVDGLRALYVIARERFRPADAG